MSIFSRKGKKKKILNEFRNKMKLKKMMKIILQSQKKCRTRIIKTNSKRLTKNQCRQQTKLLILLFLTIGLKNWSISENNPNSKISFLFLLIKVIKETQLQELLKKMQKKTPEKELKNSTKYFQNVSNHLTINFNCNFHPKSNPQNINSTLSSIEKYKKTQLYKFFSSLTHRFPKEMARNTALPSNFQNYQR